MAALVSGAVATLIGVAVLGPGETLDYIAVLREQPVSAYWDNASLPSAAARLFTENPYAQNVATLPWMVVVGFALGIITVGLTAMRVRHGPEVGLWAMVAASLLASPIAWHNYLVLLGPGISAAPGAGQGGDGLSAARFAVHPGAVAPDLERQGHGRGIPGDDALCVYPDRALARPPGSNEGARRKVFGSAAEKPG